MYNNYLYLRKYNLLSNEYTIIENYKLIKTKEM